MKQAKRHQKILELVQQSGYVSTEQLVSLLGVSSPTIRRDLTELAESNLIRRYHGGATPPSTSENSDYEDRKEFFSCEKSCIGATAASLIPNGSSLFIDIGTTSEAVAKALLQHEKLHIVTNNLNAAYILMQNPTFDITMAGGNLRSDGGLIGGSTVAFISQFYLDFCILGISSIDENGTLLDYDYREVQVKKALIENARSTILVADHSKFSRRAIVRVGTMADINYFITDQPPPESIQHTLNANNVNWNIC